MNKMVKKKKVTAVVNAIARLKDKSDKENIICCINSEDGSTIEEAIYCGYRTGYRDGYFDGKKYKPLEDIKE